MKIIYLTLLCAFSALTLSSQSFKNINELIDFSRMAPNDLEKKLKEKGFEYIETKDDRHRFRNYQQAASLSYTLNPRVLELRFEDRQFYLDAYSYLEKSGYILSKGQVVETESEEEHVAEKFTKENNELFFYQMSEDGSTDYGILVYPKASSSGSVLSDKEDFGYGCLYASFLTPKGLIAETPSLTNSTEDSFTGEVGIGAGQGWEFGLSGIAGFYGVNKKLPYFLDFGLHLRFMGGFQSYALASPDYEYKNFYKVGAGGGPSITISPFNQKDFRISFYYDFIPSVSLGGSVEYTGSNTNYSETIARIEGSYALIKVMGIELKYASISVALESSAYVDTGKYERNAGNPANLTTSNFDAAIAMNQLGLKFGFCF